MDTRILWLRRDLRLADHPALHAALDGADRVVPLFVLDPSLVRARTMSPARLSYLCDALADLDNQLRERGGRLVVRSGDPRRVLPQVAAEVGASAVHWSADSTTFAQRRDAQVAEALRAAGVPMRAHPGVAVHAPGTVRSGTGEVYRVFSPFLRAWLTRDVGRLLPLPDTVPVHGNVASEDLPTLSALDVGLAADVLAGGPRAAGQRLERFRADGAGAYHDRRNALAEDGTSRLSADLHYGCLSPRQPLAGLDRRRPGHRAFTTEIAWRDFYLHVMAAWPEVRGTEFNPDYRRLPWRGGGADFDAWAAGRTGYPIVDAGMRQLAAIGWLHNRARMIVASFLCKDLLIDWRLGQDHFLQHLVDGDVASNNGGWQWAAGTGTDAQPYFRIFNPTTQGQRFDPDGAYVRRWVPELRVVPPRWIHAPAELPAAVAADIGFVLGRDYPEPIVDHAEARRRALDWFATHKAS